MSGIQILLIGGVALIFLYYILKLRSAIFDLVVLTLFTAAAVYFILFPDYTSVLANKLGVGRGADLLFYSCILFFLFISMKLFAKVRRLEKLLTQITRRDAMNNAVVLNENETAD